MNSLPQGLDHVDFPREEPSLFARRRKRLKIGGVRKRVPGLPNFRDHGMTVTRPLLRIIGNLQRAHGYAWCSEDSLREMIYEDTGHMPGVGTVAAAIVRLEVEGYVENRWIYRGSQTPDGGTAEVGCRRLRLALDRGERRAIKARGRIVDRRADVSSRTVRTVPATFAAMRREVMRGAADLPPSSAERERAFQDSKRRQLEAAAAWAARYGDDGKSEAPS